MNTATHIVHDAPPAIAGADWMLREQGSRDWRMLPVALALWASSLASHIAFDRWSGQQRIDIPAGSFGMTILPITVFAIMTVLTLAVLCAAFHTKARWAGAIAVCLAMACIGGITAIAADTAEWRDPAAIWARNQGGLTQVHATVSAPVMTSDQREYGCRIDVRLNDIAPAMQGADGGFRHSSADVRVYAAESYCSRFHRGATYRLSGTLQEAEYGHMPLWLLLQGGDPVVQMANGPPYRTAIEHMQQSFFLITEQLSDQGRVLVPGLTMGVLGQDYVSVSPPGHVGSPLDDTYAATLEERFRRSGIMHLMAVSGGHFIMLAEAVRRLCRRWLICQQLSAGAIAGAYLVLALLVYPSDSVTRALIMGLIGAGAYALGRRSQSLSALCWTVTGTLILEPKMSQSYGFALSSAAVLGMVLFAGPIGKALGRMLPEALAQMVAMTVAAQLFTLPIQILMEPELPLLSIPANILVSPVVGFSTITGLMALACAWCLPWLAGALAWVASAGTLVMERVAMWLGGSTWSVMPWPDGISGAVLVLLIEAACMVIVMAVSRFARHRTMQDIQPSGQRFGSSRRVRFAIWWQETRRMLHMTASDGST